MRFIPSSLRPPSLFAIFSERRTGPRCRTATRGTRRFRQARHAAGQDQHGAVLRVQHRPLDMEDGTHRKGRRIAHVHAHVWRVILFMFSCYFSVVCTEARVGFDLVFGLPHISDFCCSFSVYISSFDRLKISPLFSAHHPQGGSVPWNAEVTNTDPSNFLWEKNSTAVVTVAPGMCRCLSRRWQFC